MRWPCMAACPRVTSRGHHSDCEAQHPTHGRLLLVWAGRIGRHLASHSSVVVPTENAPWGGGRRRGRYRGCASHGPRPHDHRTACWQHPLAGSRLLTVPSVGGARADFSWRHTAVATRRPDHIARMSDVGSRFGRGVPLGTSTSATSRESRMSAYGPQAAACHQATPPWAHHSRPDVGARH